MVAACAVEACDRPSHAQGWCTKHYRRWKASGDPERTKYRTLEEKLTDYVVTAAGCWEWQGIRQTIAASNVYQQIPYGRVHVPGRGLRLAHRAMYEHVHGVQLTRAQVVRHRCDYPLCVRPDHLLIGTQRDNVLDALERGRLRNQYGSLTGATA